MLDHRLLVNPPGGGVVTVKGSNVADDTPVTEVSFVEDPSGYFALRIVDAAPQAYDETEDAKRVIQGDGVYTTPAHTQPSISTSSAAVAAANANRRYLLIQNIGAATVFLRFGAAAVADQGVSLAPGAAYEMSAPGGNLYRGAINGITVSGTSTVLVTEGA